MKLSIFGQLLRGGQSSSRSLADASNLDGIDFDIGGGTNQHSDDLARQENVLNSSYAMSFTLMLGLRVP